MAFSSGQDHQVIDQQPTQYDQVQIDQMDNHSQNEMTRVDHASFNSHLMNDESQPIPHQKKQIEH